MGRRIDIVEADRPGLEAFRRGVIAGDSNATTLYRLSFPRTTQNMPGDKISKRAKRMRDRVLAEIPRKTDGGELAAIAVNRGDGECDLAAVVSNRLLGLVDMTREELATAGGAVTFSKKFKEHVDAFTEADYETDLRKVLEIAKLMAVDAEAIDDRARAGWTKIFLDALKILNPRRFAKGLEAPERSDTARDRITALANGGAELKFGGATAAAMSDES